MDEIADWVLEKRQKVHHQFYSTELKFYRRSGRMSGAAAAIGTVLGICPIMRLDDKGQASLPMTRSAAGKTAVARTVETMKRHAENGENYTGKAFICHSNCLADAEATKAAVEAAFPHLNGRGAHLRYRHDCRVAFRPRHRRGILLWRRPRTEGSAV